jgi:hypothetical protein
MGGLGYFKRHLTHPHSCSRSNETPVDTRDGQIIAGGPAVDRMSFAPEFHYAFEGEEADRAIRPPMKAKIALTVACEAARRHFDRAGNASFRHAAIRNLNRFETPFEPDRPSVFWGLVCEHEQT